MYIIWITQYRTFQLLSQTPPKHEGKIHSTVSRQREIPHLKVKNKIYHISVYKVQTLYFCHRFVTSLPDHCHRHAVDEPSRHE